MISFKTFSEKAVFSALPSELSNDDLETIYSKYFNKEVDISDCIPYGGTLSCSSRQSYHTRPSVNGGVILPCLVTSMEEAMKGQFLGFELELQQSYAMDSDDEEIKNLYDFICSENFLPSECLDLLNEKERQLVCHCECDSSLGSRGCEFILAPMSVEVYRKAKWEELFKYAVSRGWTSHKGGDCGFHVHTSKEFYRDNSAIARMLVLFSNHFEVLRQLARRSPDRLEHCDALRCDYNRAIEWANGSLTSHDYAFTSSRYTFEYRLGRGTLNFNSFNQWNELILYLIDFVNNHSAFDCENWSKVFKPRLEVNEQFKEYYNAKVGDYGEEI